MSVSGAGRVRSIDGLRGIAAMLVVVFHIHGAVSRTASDWLWPPLDWIARNGFLGVDIFFVISGFVIALSVSKGAPTLGYFGRFILRRSIRLDPPYWVAIALESVLIFLTLRLFTGYTTPMPTVPQVLAHLIYAQDLLGYPHIINIFWTLCYEIQFYGFFVGMVVLRASLPRRLQAPSVATVFCVILFGVSLLTRYWRPEWLPHGIAIDRWFQFFIGVLTWRAVTAPGRMVPLLAAWLALLVAVLVAGVEATQLLAIGVSALLVGASRREGLARVLASRPLTLLGAMSYSIYLYHSSVGWRFVGLIQKFMPGPWSPPVAISVYLLGIVVSVGFAAILWRLVEKPCLDLCQRVRLPLRSESSVPATAAPSPEAIPAR